MKKLFLLSLLAMLTSGLYAQSTENALARVKYSFTHVQDTTQKDRLYKEEMILVVGKKSSIYTSYSKALRDKAMRESIKEQVKNQAEGKMSINLQGFSGGASVTRTEYFYFPSKKNYYLKERLVSEYLIEYPIDVIDWKISKDTMSFSGIHCQKATANFKGRNWIAWFAPELPFQSGPWKLNGLPGLIIEAYDSKNEVHFQFDGLEKVTAAAAQKTEAITSDGITVKASGLDSDPTAITEIKLPKDGIITTKKEFDRLKEAFKKDPQGFMQTQTAGSANKMTTVQGIRTSDVKKSTMNNPVELSEN